VGATAQLAEPSERLTAERRPISLVLAQEGCEPFRPSDAVLTRAQRLLTISAAADTLSDRSSNPNASLVWFWPPAFRISRMFPARS
jgi:hypothetical protein